MYTISLFCPYDLEKLTKVSLIDKYRFYWVQQSCLQGLAKTKKNLNPYFQFIKNLMGFNARSGH